MYADLGEGGHFKRSGFLLFIGRGDKTGKCSLRGDLLARIFHFHILSRHGEGCRSDLHCGRDDLRISIFNQYPFIIPRPRHPDLGIQLSLGRRGASADISSSCRNVAEESIPPHIQRIPERLIVKACSVAVALDSLSVIVRSFLYASDRMIIPVIDKRRDGLIAFGMQRLTPLVFSPHGIERHIARHFKMYTGEQFNRLRRCGSAGRPAREDIIPDSAFPAQDIRDDSSHLSLFHSLGRIGSFAIIVVIIGNRVCNRLPGVISGHGIRCLRKRGRRHCCNEQHKCHKKTQKHFFLSHNLTLILRYSGR